LSVNRPMNPIELKEHYEYIEKVIRKEEREKVLDDLQILFQWTNREGNFRTWNIGHIEEVLRKYREAK
jgi:hypothetical protein